MTFYRGLSGKRALFDPGVKEGVGMESITDVSRTPTVCNCHLPRRSPTSQSIGSRSSIARQKERGSAEGCVWDRAKNQHHF